MKGMLVHLMKLLKIILTMLRFGFYFIIKFPNGRDNFVPYSGRYVGSMVKFINYNYYLLGSRCNFNNNVKIHRTLLYGGCV